jgi:hypothetical protein
MKGIVNEGKEIKKTIQKPSGSCFPLLSYVWIIRVYLMT